MPNSILKLSRHLNASARYTLLHRSQPLYETFLRGTTNFGQITTAGLLRAAGINGQSTLTPYAPKFFGTDLRPASDRDKIRTVFYHVTDNNPSYISLSRNPEDAHSYAHQSPHAVSSPNIALVDAKSIIKYHKDYIDVQEEIKKEEAKPTDQRTLTPEQLAVLKEKALDHEVMIKDTLSVFVRGVIIFDHEADRVMLKVNEDHIPFEVIESNIEVKERVLAIAALEDEMLKIIRAYADQNGLKGPLSADAM